MRFFRNALAFCAGVAALGGVLAIRAELGSWAQNALGGSAVEAALFRAMALPGGPVLGRRPPAESVGQMNTLVEHAPQQADLYAIRAQEKERNFDFAGAEEDWRHASSLAADKSAALTDLADFYHRRLEAQKEVAVAVDIGKLAAAGQERYKRDELQTSWMAFHRALGVAESASLTAASSRSIYETWVARYPKAKEPYRLYLDALIREGDIAGARALATRIRSMFPQEEQFQIETESKVAGISGGPNAALAVYSAHFTPLWPAEIRTSYYQLLSTTHELRTFLATARTASAANPTALNPVLQLFFYYEQESKPQAADQELLALVSRRSAAKTVWTSDELSAAAALFERVQDYDESARLLATQYELPSGTTESKEAALGALVSLLLEVPEQQFRFGERDLSLYRNIAQMDRDPGFLNGILSLALNTSYPQYQYQTASGAANTYFHRATAARLLELMERTFPNSNRTGALQAKLFSAYAAYGQSEALIRLVPAWLARTGASSPDAVNAAMLLADAYSQQNRSADEFALYDRLLGELAAASDHVPLGPEALVKTSRELPAEGVPPASTAGRSPDYVRVLDRYVTRLTQAKRLRDAVALYRREIDRNPDDAGLYERLALYVEQNRFDADLIQTYEQAFKEFGDASWAAKLARFYLRKKQYADYQALTQQITGTFTGSKLAAFLGGVEPNARLNPVLYRQINLYAHQRFPHNLAFTRNLLNAYQMKAIADPIAYEKLLRQTWFYDAGLRRQFFEYLDRTGKLQGELAVVASLDTAAQSKNVVAMQLRAEGEAWRTNYEAAAPAFVRLAQLTPGDREMNSRAIAVERSLAPTVSGAFDTAVKLAEQDSKAAPRDTMAITRVGEIYADPELYPQATPWWNRIAAVEPGSPDGYLQAATVFWDYFEFGDALRQITRARQTFHQGAVFAYEAGAIYENEGDYPHAVQEYMRAAVEDPPSGENGAARNRLFTLARRQSSAGLVERDSAALTAGAFHEQAFDLRVALLENQGRREDIHALVKTQIARATQASEVDLLRKSAEHFGFEDSSGYALERVVALTSDPVEKMQARLDLASFRETHNDVAGAQRELSQLLQENPDLLGVVRANVDFHWREKQYPQAVETLTAAASRAQPPYVTQFRREAAEKAAQAGEYDVSQKLLDDLLAGDPFNGDLLAQKARTFALARDDNGLVQFYTGELKSLEAAALPGKADLVGTLRRGYIPALIKTGQTAAALDQYELLLNQFPEDENLAREVALFSQSHQLADRLTAYYGKAVSDSPRDYRWPLVLARIDAVLSHYSDAISAYGKAVQVRPDRTDILAAQADLEIRLLRFDDALKANQKLYELSYHDSKYLVQQAEIGARMGNKPEAVRLLRAAYVDARPKEPNGYVAAMRQLSAWQMFTELDAVYQDWRRLVTVAGEETGEAVALEAQALTSLHRPADAMNAVAEAFRNIADFQADASDLRFSNAIGEAAKAYLTPEEKGKFAAAIQRPGALPVVIHLRDLARAAGLTEIEAKTLGGLTATDSNNLYALQALQASRLAYEALGRQLETAARTAKQDYNRDQLVRGAIEAYGHAGDAAGQMRLAGLRLNGGVPAMDAAQHAALLVASDAGVLTRLGLVAKHDPALADAIVQYLIANRPAGKVKSAIAARGSSLPRGWTDAYTALAGLYFLTPDAWVEDAFGPVLGARTVGAELANWQTPANVALQHEQWFYYAARLGDYLGYRGQTEAAEELLPAYLESAPSASNSYLSLGDTYEDLKQGPRALALYENALQLSPQSAGVYDRIAIAQARLGRRTEAVQSWRHALELLARRVEEGPLPAEYWPTAQAVLTHVNEWKATSELKPGADAMLRAYAKRNGGYNFEPFVTGILTDASDHKAALDWILELARTRQLGRIVDQLVNSPLLTSADKDALYRFEIEQAAAEANQSAGDAATAAREQLEQAQIEYVNYLEAQQRPQEAWNVVQQIQPANRRPADLVLRVGAASGHAGELLRLYRSQPDAAPQGEQILAIASGLSSGGHSEIALQLEEFEYERELRSSSSTGSAYFGLAQVRIDQKRNAEALALLETVTVTVGAPFENLPEAVRFLTAAKMKTEALQYATRWRTAEPWNAEAQLAEARIKGDASRLNAVRESGAAGYQVRVQAANELQMLGQSMPGSDELALLTHKTIAPAEASQPYFVAARLQAARELPGDAASKVELLREAIRTDPAIQQERLPLAEAGFRTKQNALGIAALDSFLSLGGSKTPEQQVRLQRTEEMAAGVLIQERNFAKAIGLYDQMLSNLPEGSERERIQKLRAAVQTQSQLAAINAGRQPVISKELNQPYIVKPRLASLPSAGGTP